MLRRTDGWSYLKGDTYRHILNLNHHDGAFALAYVGSRIVYITEKLAHPHAQNATFELFAHLIVISSTVDKEYIY